MDRLGDTFRWHGENCSTTQVTEVLSTFPGISECNVYGVEVPSNADGRAPMAALRTTGGLAGSQADALDLRALAAHLREHLPSYAVPVFLRLLPAAVETTSTFKHKKVQLRAEGIDPTRIRDPVLWLPRGGEAYERFGPVQMQQVIGGSARL